MEQSDIDAMITAICNDMTVYTEETVKKVKKAVDEEAKRLVNAVKADSPVKTGEYKRGWGKKTLADKDGRYLLAAIQKTPKKSIVHLLERGHKTRYKGKEYKYARTYPHVTGHQTEAYKNLDKKLKDIL
ncbi:MAG: HK97 gp10 family phage protein [Ruminococcus sp.]|nr:HK97 gp10 family phage protein [Ruminococcus sp.]